MALRNALWSGRLKDFYGVCAHPNFTKTVYGDIAAWTSKADTLGAWAIRGMYTPAQSQNAATTQALRAKGLKWNAEVVPEAGDVTEAEVRDKIAHIAANAADVVVSIEGMNEPNHDRDGTSRDPAWATKTAAWQKVIWDAVKSHPSLAHIKVVSPSLHNSVSTVEQDYYTLAATGITRYFDVVGLHCYPSGQKPDGNGKLQQRLGWIRTAYGPKPVWMTETGYHNAVNQTSGQLSVPESVSNTYGPRAVLDLYRLGLEKMFRYELLDDPDPRKVEMEYNFGLVRTPQIPASYWTDKAEFLTMTKFLNDLTPKAAESSKSVELTVSSPSPDVVQTLVWNGQSVYLYMHRDVAIYDPKAKKSLTVPTVSVKITDKNGTRSVSVGSAVKRFLIAQ